MNRSTDDTSTRVTQEWFPSYWVKEAHGSSWEQVKAALQRDWEQTKPPNWADAEAGVRYGFGARKQYGATHEKWSDELEVKLSSEWNEEKTGKPFSAVRLFVLHGWNSSR